MTIRNCIMLTRIFISLVLFGALIACNSTDQSLHEVIRGDTLYLYDVPNELLMKGPVKNGLKNGEFHSFLNGNLRSTSNYINDTLNGISNEYYPSGVLKSTAFYVNGVKYGEELVFYDSHQDSTAVKIDGEWYIAPYSTHLNAYKFRDLKGNVHYERTYDVEGNLLSKSDNIFLFQERDTIKGKVNQTIKQIWLTPALLNVQQLNIDQFYVIKGNNLIDTIFNNPDSLYTSWKTNNLSPGNYKFEAIAYLMENKIIETDTSEFIVQISN